MISVTLKTRTKRLIIHEAEWLTSIFNLVPRIFVPYCACWLDETRRALFPDRWSRGTKTLGTRVKYLTKRSSHMSISLPKTKSLRREKTETNSLQKHLGNLKKTWGYFTVGSCTPMTRPRAHTPIKTRGRPAGQDTSSYSTWHSVIVWYELYQTFCAHEEILWLFYDYLHVSSKGREVFGISFLVGGGGGRVI